MTDERFGHLAVVALAGRRRKKVVWLCQCDCGQTCLRDARSLRVVAHKSCGCVKISRHEASLKRAKAKKSQRARPPEWRSWREAKRRCFNANRHDYGNYGGRGIVMCSEWRKSFSAFLAHIGPKPSPELTLDRIEADGNYEPGNVRWATRAVQSQNQRRHKKLQVA